MPTTTIFWPTDVHCAGICYGWSEPAICVAGVANSEEVAAANLKRIQTSPEWSSINTECGKPPRILGSCAYELDRKPRNKARAPRKLDFVNGDYTFVYYRRHEVRTLRFYSLKPLELDSRAKDGHKLRDKLKSTMQYDFTSPSRMTQPFSALTDATINQFNSSKIVEKALEVQVSEDYLSPTFSGVTAFFESGIALASGATAAISRILSNIFSMSIPLGVSSPLLRDVSATIQQIDVRVEQADFLTHQAESLRVGVNSASISSYAARYVNFYNAIWLILNDITLGVAIGTFLCENDKALADLLRQFVKALLIDWVQWVLTWLNSWPAGLKLNTELSRFYSHSFIDLVLLWGRAFEYASPHLPSTIYVIGILSCLGMTMSISLLSDLLALLTGHIYICYLISTTIYRRQLMTAASLWNLFRGKRYNVLRRRMDSWEYDMDQLLFGTILFTLVAFLFPTVVAYHALFAIMRFLTVLVHACMETVLAFMNHFPLFAIMLRIKDSSRLPGGIYFTAHTSGQDSFMMNNPISFPSIFFQYLRLWSKLSAHYHPLRLLRRVVAGEYVAVIPRYSIRYNKVEQI